MCVRKAEKLAGLVVVVIVIAVVVWSSSCARESPTRPSVFHYGGVTLTRRWKGTTKPCHLGWNNYGSGSGCSSGTEHWWRRRRSRHRTIFGKNRWRYYRPPVVVVLPSRVCVCVSVRRVPSSLASSPPPPAF